MKEIERKFIVEELRLSGGSWNNILYVHQAYVVAMDNFEVRIRYRGVTPSNYHLAIKLGAGIVRDEWEWRVPRWLGKLAFAVAGDRYVKKVRLRGERYEIDVFQNEPWNGLILAEVELTDPHEPLPGAPAGVRFGREVTHDANYKNKALAAGTAVYLAANR